MHTALLSEIVDRRTRLFCNCIVCERDKVEEVEASYMNIDGENLL